MSCLFFFFFLVFSTLRHITVHLVDYLPPLVTVSSWFFFLILHYFFCGVEWWVCQLLVSVYITEIYKYIFE